MRTTVTIQDQLLEEAKSAARHRGCTLGVILDDSLRHFLLDRKQIQKKTPPPLPTFRGQGLRQGLDLTSNSSLLDAMEDR